MTVQMTVTASVDQIVAALLTDLPTASAVYARLGEQFAALDAALALTPQSTSLSTNLGDALREHMHVNRLTRREMAASLGISYPYLCELLNGHKVPGKKALEGLTALGIVNFA